MIKVLAFVILIAISAVITYVINRIDSTILWSLFSFMVISGVVLTVGIMKVKNDKEKEIRGLS